MKSAIDSAVFLFYFEYLFLAKMKLVNIKFNK